VVVDTSALVAYSLREPPAGRILKVLEGEATPVLSAVSLVECTMVLQGRRGDAGVRAFDTLRWPVSASRWCP